MKVEWWSSYLCRYFGHFNVRLYSIIFGGMIRIVCMSLRIWKVLCLGLSMIMVVLLLSSLAAILAQGFILMWSLGFGGQFILFPFEALCEFGCAKDCIFVVC